MTTRRRKARQAAVEVLYRRDQLDDPIEDLVTEVARRLELDANARRFLHHLVEKTDACRTEIDAALTRTLKHWELSRLSFVDRAILRMACCEILHFPDIPSNVSINEAVEIAKSLGGDESGQFVNGVLDAVSREQRAAAPISDSTPDDRSGGGQ
jgi:transcription antitermination protein NusB